MKHKCKDLPWSQKNQEGYGMSSASVTSAHLCISSLFCFILQISFLGCDMQLVPLIQEENQIKADIVKF